MSQPKLQPSIDFGYPTEAHGRIPAFNDIEEEAEFWDTHDLADLWEEAAPVQVEVAKDLGSRMTIRLDADDRTALDQIARETGIGPSTLVRIWVRERLRQEADKARRVG